MNVQRTNNTKDKARELQVKLYLSAKANKTRKFHGLYDKIYRMDIFEKAWKNVKTNNGSAGIDEVTIKEIEEIEITKFFKEIQQELQNGEYRPKPILRVEIPKSNGKMRPLGIPTVEDRIAQMVAKLYFEPQVESIFYQDSYGYRPNKSAIQAVKVTRTRCWEKDWVLEFDIKGLFDNIRHDILM